MTESGSKVVEFQRSDESEGFITNTHENIVDLYNKKMAEYAQEFQKQSQGLMGYIQGQLSSVVSWTALPGQLNKIVTSSAGYVWGFNLYGNIYTCKEPCNGQNWRGVEPPPERRGMPADIAVDGENVYILYTGTVKSVKLDGKWTFINGTESGDLVQIGNSWTFTPSNPDAVTRFGWTQLRGTFDPGSTTSGEQVYITPTARFPMTFTIDSTGNSIVGSNGGTLTRASSGVSSSTANQLVFSSRPVDGTGSWSEPQQIPGTAPANPTIHMSDQFIFVGTQGCSKPCTTGSWIPISQPSGGQGIIAASSGNTYALGANNTIYQSSGNGQGGWTEQGGMEGVMPLAVGADSQFILGVNQSSSRPVRCSPPYTEDDSCQADSTFAYRPMAGSHTVSVNPRSYQTYVAASSSGSVGNLYQRVDPGSIDNSGVLDDTRQYLSGMDSSINSLGTATSTQDAQIQVGKVKQAANSVIKRISDIREERENTAAERDRIKRKIQTVGGPPSEYRMKILQTITITLALVLLSYFVLGLVLPPWINMSIAVVGMLVGLGFAISFAVNKQ